MRFLRGVKDWAKTFAYVLYIIVTQCWQLAGVVVIAIYNDRPWECLFLFIGFKIGQKFFGKTYHAPTMMLCTLITWVTFYFMTAALPSFHISYTLPCVFGVVLAFALSVISGLIEKEK